MRLPRAIYTNFAIYRVCNFCILAVILCIYIEMYTLHKLEDEICVQHVGEGGGEKGQ